MWIQLTGGDGESISLNSDHLILIKDHGGRTLVVHTRGEAVVMQSQSAIVDALSLQRIDRTVPKREPRDELH